MDTSLSTRYTSSDLHSGVGYSSGKSFRARRAAMPEGQGLAAETTEETAFLLGGGVLLFGMILIAPLLRGHLFPHRVDVLAAAFPGGLSAYFTGGGSTHDCLLR